MALNRKIEIFRVLFALEYAPLFYFEKIIIGLGKKWRKTCYRMVRLV